MTPFLGANLTSTTPQIFRSVNLSETFIGASTGTVHTYVAAHCQRNPAVVFRGFVFWKQRGQILRSRTDCQTYDVVYSNADDASSEMDGGLHVVYASDGVPYLVSYFGNGAGQARCASSLDGTTWATSGAVSSRQPLCTVAYNGRLIIATSQSVTRHVQNIESYDPVTNTLTTNAALGTNAYGGRLVVWNGILHLVGGEVGGPNRLSIAMVNVGAGLFNIQTLNSSQTYDGSQLHMAFVDPATNNLIVVGRGNSSWIALELTPGIPYGVTDRTSTMLTGGVLGTYTASYRGHGVIFDQDSNPGGNPDIYLLASAGNTAADAVSMFRYNGPTALLGDGAGSANDTGGQTQFSYPDGNIGGERFFTPRSLGVGGSPSVQLTGRGALVIASSRRRFRAYRPISTGLVTIGGVDATHDLSTTPLPITPIQPNSVAIRVETVADGTQYIVDNGAGVLSNVLALSAPGTVDYATGAMTGVTVLLSASSDVEGLANAGLANVQLYRTPAVDGYPGASAPAALSSPTHGSVTGGDTNSGVPADGTECQINVNMSGYTVGDRFGLQPRVTT